MEAVVHAGYTLRGWQPALKHYANVTRHAYGEDHSQHKTRTKKKRK